MATRLLAACLALAASFEAVAGAAGAPSAAQILERYAAARGGAEAWSRVQSMAWAGHIEAPDSRSAAMPFVLYFQRPNAMRFELTRQTQRSVRTFNGKRGWKMRPGGERGVELLDYSAEELAAARDACGLDGPLSDPAGKGVVVSVEGSDIVDGHPAWRLKLVLPSGAIQHHWISAESYLELRYDRLARDPAGREGMLVVSLRNYQKVGDLQIPMLAETRPAGGGPAERMVIEQVALDPKLPPDAFDPPDTRPLHIPRHGGVVVNATSH